MKIIFLDIDGVLNTRKTYKDIDDNDEMKVEIDEFRVAFLKQICDQTGAQVVLSSSKRKGWNTPDYSLKENASIECIETDKILKKFNIKLYGIVGKGTNCVTQDDIYEWLNNHPEVESFVIFDDETIYLMDFVGNALIQTSNIPPGQMIRDMRDYTGILEEHIQLAIDILNKKVKTLRRTNLS